MLIEQEKLRIDARLNRKLAQEPGAEPVNRGADRAIQSALVVKPMPALGGRGSLQNQVEFFPEPLAHFVRGAIGEGDSDYLIDVEVGVLTKDMKIALDQYRCLPRPRAGRHRDMFRYLVSGSGLLGQ